MVTEHERDEWMAVAEKLGFQTKNGDWVGPEIWMQGHWFALEYWIEAMLHGLACLRCNGSVYRFDPTDDWIWEIRDASGSIVNDDGAATQSEALLTMLQIHEEDEHAD